MSNSIKTAASAAALGLALTTSLGVIAQTSPYAGEQTRSIKALVDRLFADRQATPERVSEATQRIAALQAQLRAEHLNTHLAQTALMSAAQTRRYAELRGYTAAATTPTPGHDAGHKHRH